MLPSRLFAARIGIITLIAWALLPRAGAQAQGLKPDAPREPIATLAMDPEAAKEKWTIGMPVTVVQDDVLKRAVLDVTTANHAIELKQPLTGPCEIVVQVRLPNNATQSGVVLGYGRPSDGDWNDLSYGISAFFVPSSGARTLQLGTRMGAGSSGVYFSKHELRSDQLTQARMTPIVYFMDFFRDISPVWDPEFRQEIESAMARVPVVNNTWFEIRIEHRADSIRMYRDGYLLGERSPAGRVNGTMELRVMGSARIGALTVRPLPDQPDPFVPVRLDGHISLSSGASSLGLKSDQVPATGGEVRVHEIPFVLAGGADGLKSIDVGQSLFRYRNREGHVEALQSWPSPYALDPGRITFSVPNRPYTRLWVVAASEDNPNKVPLITARFYRGYAGFPVDAQANIPLVTARGDVEGARRIDMKTADGKDASLWLVPIELNGTRIASEFREDETLSMEITKQVFPYRTYPDPANYSWFQGGLASAAHIYAMTLEQAPVRLTATSSRTGNAFIAPEEPVWIVKLQNLRARKYLANVRVIIRDPQGKETTHTRSMALEPLSGATQELAIKPEVVGLHDVTTTVSLEGFDQKPAEFSLAATFIQLPPDTRNSPAATARWGLWNWGGGHLTNANALENLYLNRAAGGRYGSMGTADDRRVWGMRAGPSHVQYGPEPWALKDPIDQAEYNAFSDKIGLKAAEALKTGPDIPSFSIFTETAISERVTYGVPPEYLGEGELVMNDEEKKRYRAFTITLKAACEGIRKHAPQAKIALGWCEPIFAVPFLKDKFPPELFDLIGVDSPQFERMPEMPIREVSPSRMWMLKEAMKKYGYESKPVIHTESYYPSSHPLALGFRGSADSYVRTGVLALAQGTTIFANCWTLYDCGNYWGNQHYGCIGIVGRWPEYNPKPAFAAFATMTRLIDAAPFDGFVQTGSQSVYCVRFKRGVDFVYCLWTIRGTRPVTLRFAKDAKDVKVIFTPESGEDRPLTVTDNAVTVELSPTAIWLRSAAAIQAVEPGTPLYTEKPGPDVKVLDTLATPWRYDPAEDAKYAANHFGAPRYAGPMKSEAVDSADRKTSGGKVWQITLDKPVKERPLAAWYGSFYPAEPVTIPGKAKALGIWANGKSNWGRIIYEIQDAKGEIWQSVGTKDDWNCDDVHSWSSFNFDGWRYIEFPLPNHEPGDNYRGHDTVWWNHNASGVVDLPVKLTRIMIEQRTHNVYVDKLIENADRSVQLSDLTAVYASPQDMTDAPVLAQQRAAGLIKFTAADPSQLPNAIAKLATDGIGVPTAIEKVAPPEHFYDGTRVDVTIKPAAGATEYRVYVSAHENGAGAKQLAKGPGPMVPVTGLRPEFPLYLFVTYVDAAAKESKPSTPATRVLLKDDFPMK